MYVMYLCTADIMYFMRKFLAKIKSAVTILCCLEDACICNITLFAIIYRICSLVSRLPLVFISVRILPQAR